jgi:hypothetical protein
MIDSLANSLASEVFTPEGVTHPAMGMPHAQMVSHAYGHHAAPKRTWVGLTDEEIKTIEETTTCAGNESWLRNLTKNIEDKLKEKNT